MAFTPRTLRRRKLLQRNSYVDPEVASLYHDEPRLDSPSSSLMSTAAVNQITLGTPTRTHRQTDTTTFKTDSFPNVYAPPSLSLAERLNRIQYEEDANNKRKTSRNRNDSNPVLDLQKYEMIPNKIKLALSSAGQEKLFIRNDLFKEPEPRNTDSTSPTRSSSLSVAPSPNRVYSSSSSPSTITTTMDDDNQGAMTPIAFISPVTSSPLACSSPSMSVLDDDQHQTGTASVATPIVIAPTSSSLSVASSPNRVSSSSASPSTISTTTMDDDDQGAMTPIAFISPETSSPLACASPPVSTLDDDHHQTETTSVATPIVIAPTSPTSSVISVATSISETMDISLMSWPGSPAPSSAKPLHSPLSFGRVTPSHRQETDTTTTTTTAHPLATELTNPFLESTSATAPSPPPPPPQPESIIVSKRMQQRFPHHTSMSRRQRNSGIPAPSKWHVTTIIPSSTFCKPTHASPTIRQKWIISDQPPKHKVTKPTKQKVARSRQNTWKVTSNITTPVSDSHNNRYRHHRHRRHPRINSLHHVSNWLISNVPSS